MAFLECQGCFHLPDEQLLYTFLRHYFLYVHPSLPLVDEAQFWRLYRRNGEDGAKLSLLLLRTMIFAAAYVIIGRHYYNEVLFY